MFSEAALKYQGAKKEENLDDSMMSNWLVVACSEENEKALFAQMGEWMSNNPQPQKDERNVHGCCPETWSRK